MNSELINHLTAERSDDRLQMSPNSGNAYDTLVEEVNEARKELPAQGFNQYLQSFLDNARNMTVAELAIVHASRNFESLDQNQDGLIKTDELAKRKAGLTEDHSPGVLPKEIETAFLDNLSDNLDILRGESKDGSMWTLHREPNGISREDLRIVDNRNNSLREQFARQPFLADKYVIAAPAGMPASVKTLFDAAGMQFKSVPGLLRNHLKKHHKEFYTTAIASGLYSASTNEIMTEQGDFETKAQQHEVGHFVDDSLVAGKESFSDSSEYVAAISKDMSNLSTTLEWNTVFPGAHLFVRSGLYSGSMGKSARKEVFADLYQSNNIELACQMRQVFPNTASLIDLNLSKNGIDRFVSEKETKDCRKTAPILTS